MLKEVDLSSLSIVHIEPVGVGELLGEVAIARVRVAVLWGLLLSWEGFAMNLIVLLHDLPAEGSNTDTHGHKVYREDILENDSHGED